MRFLWLLVALALVKITQSIIHHLKSALNRIKYEKYLFADRNGPFGIGGDSHIRVKAHIEALHDEDSSHMITIHRLDEYFHFAIVAVVYTEVEVLKDLDEHTACSRDYTDTFEKSLEGVLHGELHIITPKTPVDIIIEYRPKTNGKQYVMMIPCWKQKDQIFGYPVSASDFVMYPMENPVLSVNGTVEFYNPYGYLPNVLYGIFPFSEASSVLYGFGFVNLLSLSDTRLGKLSFRLQSMLFVFTLASVEITCWLLSYKILNEKKLPVVCSYALTIILKAFFKAVAGVQLRVLTTLICLGYGTIRSCVTRYEIIFVTGLGMLYFVSIAIVEVNDRLYPSSKRNSILTLWELITVVSNLTFVGWILKMLIRPRHKLLFRRGDSGGNAEKNHSLHAFIAVTLCCMGMEGTSYSGILVMEWKYMWLIWVSNRLVIYTLLLCIVNMQSS
uniref:Uncharacterized protein AlNc14C122G6703 n=1 Tax=Albugo laibachii Nc14 TaxID=890382 RepID=F0WJH8_9STRA|nr:conserved hypothetical protein [Albugo laibachii Nc14]|eukprot:CCA21427.1 conserved hypothetical protein [Albugo laibachii Nc14]